MSRREESISVKMWVRGAFWVVIYLAVVMAPLGVLLLAPTPRGGSFWWDFAIGLGFAGLVMMGVQFLLTARFRRATAPFGIDVVYYFHRYFSYVLLAVVLGHPVILLVENPALVSTLNPLEAPWEMTAGVASVVLLLAVMVTSIGRKYLRIPYDGWRVAHLALSVGAVGLGFAHMGGVGFYVATPAVAAVWTAIGASLVVLVLWVRVIRPARLLRTPYRVAEVRRERGDAWTLRLEPDGHVGFPFHPGQFCWVTLRSSPFAMQEHPFSMSSAPRLDGSLDFTIKELGDFTRTVGTIQPGEIAYVDGPYGAFTIDRHARAAGFVFVAGGIGVAPMLSMLTALADRRDKRPHVVFSAHSTWERASLRDALDALQERLDLKVVHVLEEPPEDWDGETGWLTRDILDRHLPAERTGHVYFVCGPIPMIRATERFLHELGIPMSRFHTELFDLA